VAAIRSLTRPRLIDQIPVYSYRQNQSADSAGIVCRPPDTSDVPYVNGLSAVELSSHFLRHEFNSILTCSSEAFLRDRVSFDSRSIKTAETGLTFANSVVAHGPKQCLFKDRRKTTGKQTSPTTVRRSLDHSSNWSIQQTSSHIYLSKHSYPNSLVTLSLFWRPSPLIVCRYHLLHLTKQLLPFKRGSSLSPLPAPGHTDPKHDLGSSLDSISISKLRHGLT
jgi:hypothetical protein